MSILPVNAIFSGIQTDGYFLGTPSLIIQLMDHPQAAIAVPESHDGSYPLPEWDHDPANEISFNRLVSLRGSSPHFANVGATSLTTLALTFRERHVLIVGRELGLHDIGVLVQLLLDAGRSVQIETTALAPSLAIARTWLTLLMLPSKIKEATPPDALSRPNEVLACIRSRTDLDRTEGLYANRKVPVWLRPSQHAEGGIFRQCLAVATRHPGWRVIRPGRPVDIGI